MDLTLMRLIDEQFMETRCVYQLLAPADTPSSPARPSVGRRMRVCETPDPSRQGCSCRVARRSFTPGHSQTHP